MKDLCYVDLNMKFRIYNTVDETILFQICRQAIYTRKITPLHISVAIAASTFESPRPTTISVLIFEQRPSSLAIEVNGNHAFEESKFPDTVGLSHALQQYSQFHTASICVSFVDYDTDA